MKEYFAFITVLFVVYLCFIKIGKSKERITNVKIGVVVALLVVSSTRSTAKFYN